jgi:general secretion pathway protein B
MSYILDALKRSERERQDGQAPLLRSIHADFHARSKDAQVRLRLFTIISLVVVGTGFGVWLAKVDFDWALLRDGTRASGGNTAATTPQIESPLSSTDREDVRPSPGATEMPIATAVDVPLPDMATDMLEVWQLSEAEQRFLDSLNVSLHVYSPEPLQRTVIINGLRAKEGQTLGQDLQLLEITSDGIIVQFQQQRVHLATIE